MPPSKRRKLSVGEPDKADDIKGWCAQSVAGASSYSEQNTEKKLGFGLCEKTPESPKDGKGPRAKSIKEPGADVKQEDPPKPTRISERLSIKRSRIDNSTEDAAQSQSSVLSQTPSKKSRNAQVSVKQGSKGKSLKPLTKTKKRRPWALWSVCDKRLFFAGLGEFGKDFEALSNKISHVAKLRGVPVKDKVQVRYFYYRCWAKISKFVDMKGLDVKPVTQELYGLINYGVIRHHIKETDPSFGRCLSEMIYKGETSYVAKKGKKIRTKKLRTPICTYLKKINKVGEKKSQTVSSSHKLPQDVMLELTPRNSRAWAKVQSMSQNPRIRFKLTSNRTLSSVFKYLESKWKPRRSRIKDALSIKEDLNEEIVCFLHPKCKIMPVQLIPRKQAKIDITFNNYIKNILPTLEKRKKPKVSKESEEIVDSEKGDVPVVNNSSPKLNDVKADERDANHGNHISNKFTESERCDVVEGGNSFFHALNLEQSAAMNKPIPEQKDHPPVLATFLGINSSGSNSMEDKDASKIRRTDSTSSPRVALNSPVLIGDENAMFPDPLSFSLSSSASASATAVLSSDKSAVTSSEPSNVSSSSASLLTSVTTTSSSTVILSPMVHRKKSSKAAKDNGSSVETKPLTSKCDTKSASITSTTENSCSPEKAEPDVDAEELRNESEKEMQRLSALATSEGFTMKNSNTVTLLHLSLLLGREDLIRLEYEWREKRKLKNPCPPVFCQAANQMANVLRRLCNIAALELADLSAKSISDSKSQSKPQKKNEPCSLCGGGGAAFGKSNAGGRKKLVGTASREKSGALKDSSTMTDPVLTNPVRTVYQHTPSLSDTLRTYVAGAPQGTTLQVNVPDPAFRVPRAPSLKPLVARDDQPQARTIMNSEPRSKIKSRRTLTPKSRKGPPIIVQRTLLPKVPAAEMLTYIQQKTQSGQLLVKVSPGDVLKIGQPVANIINTAAEAATQNKSTGELDRSEEQAPAGVEGKQRGNGLNLTENSMINVPSTQRAEKLDQNLISHQSHDPPMSLQLNSPANPVNSSKELEVPVPSNMSTPEKMDPALAAQADISISDFDLSIGSVLDSNLGPEAGDKFLDMVMQNSEQGFSGLIENRKGLDSDNAHAPALVDTSTSFNPSVLQTPPHFGSSAYQRTGVPSMYPSPDKLNIPEQAWTSVYSGDVSLSSILDISSSFQKIDNSDQLKTPVKLSPPLPVGVSGTFLESTSNDLPDSSSLSFSKPNLISDLSLSSLLGDSSNFSKKDESSSLPSVSLPEMSTSKHGNNVDAVFSSAMVVERPPSSLFNEASSDSFVKLDDDGALQGMVNDSSLDLVSKFESLAAHIADRQDQEHVHPTVSVSEKPDRILTISAAGPERIVKLGSPGSVT